jgi:hypothetical protein
MAVAIARGSPLHRSVLVALQYVALVMVAAGSTPLVGDKVVPLGVWLGGTALLSVQLLRVASQASPSRQGVIGRLALAGPVAATVAILACVAFVAMMNIWEYLGLG